MLTGDCEYGDGKNVTLANFFSIRGRRDEPRRAFEEDCESMIVV